MSKPFSFRVYTAQDISSAAVVEKLWRVLDTPLIKPVLFDKAQAPKRAFCSGGAASAPSKTRSLSAVRCEQPTCVAKSVAES